MLNRVMLLSAAVDCHPFPASFARGRPDENDQYNLSDVNRNDDMSSISPHQGNQMTLGPWTKLASS